MKASLRQVILMTIATVLVFALVSVNFIQIYKNARQNQISIHQNEILRAAGDANHVLDSSIDAVRTTAYTLDQMMKKGKAGEEDIYEYLTIQSDTYRNVIDQDFDGLYGVFNGTYIDGVGWEPQEGYIPEERPWYRSALASAGKVALVSPYVDAQTGNVMMSVSCLLSDRKSVVSLDVSLTGLQKLVEEVTAKNHWKYSIIVDQDDYIIAHSDKSMVGKNMTEEQGSFNSAIAKSLREAAKGPAEISYGGKAYFVFAADIGNSWWSIAVMEDTALQGKYRELNTLLVFSVIVILFVTGIGVYGVRKEHKKMTEVSEQVVTAGQMFEMSYLIDLKSDTYVEMDEYSLGYESSEKQIKHAQTNLRSIMDSITDERFKAAIFTFTNLETLPERLEGVNSILREFTDTRNRRCCGRFVAMKYSNEGKLERVLWVVEVIGERRRTALP